MSTEHSPVNGESIESETILNGVSMDCSVCESPLERTSQHSATNRQTILFGCPECRVGAVAVLDQDGPLSDRCLDRLERAQNRAMTGLSVYRLAAFVTDEFPNGRYLIERVDEHEYVIDVPQSCSPWEVLRLVESLSVGSMDADRCEAGVRVVDARWSSIETDEELDAVPDGGVEQISGTDRTAPGRVSDPFVVAEDDEPRTERAKTEDIDVSLLEKGGLYEVHSASDSYYEVDVVAEQCSCPDTAERCKHLRRVDLEIRAGLVPRPDGRLP